MPPATPPRDLATELARGQIDPVYCLTGRERFLLDRALEALRQAVLEPATRAFNYDVLEARTAQAGGIVAAARTLPMLARRRLVLARGVDELKPDAVAPLVEYLGDPAPETVLVLLCDKVDARQKLFAALRRKGALVAFEPLRERELFGFIRAEAVARGTSISEAAARLLGDVVGADLGTLAQSIEKLALYVGPGRRVSEDDVAACVHETRVRSIFDLVNAVGQGNRAEALRLGRRMLDDREEPLRVLAMLARHVRQLLRARELLGARAGKMDIAQALGVNPYFVDGLCAQARRFSTRGLGRAMAALYATDKALKSSKLPDDLLLERLLGELVGLADGGGRREA